MNNFADKKCWAWGDKEMDDIIHSKGEEWKMFDGRKYTLKELLEFIEKELTHGEKNNTVIGRVLNGHPLKIFSLQEANWLLKLNEL